MEEKGYTPKPRVRKITLSSALVFAAITLIIGFVLGKFVIPNIELNSAKKNVTELTQKAEGLENDLQVANTKISSLSEKANSLQSEKDELSKEVDRLNGVVSEKDTQIENAIRDFAVSTDEDEKSESSPSLWFKWLMIAFISTILIVSASMVISSFLANNKKTSSVFSESESEEDSAWKKVVSGAGSRIKEQESLDKSTITEAIALLEDGTLEDKVIELGGFFMGITNLVAILEGRDKEPVFKMDESGDYVAFYTNGKEAISVIPRTLEIDSAQIEHRHLTDMFKIRNSVGTEPCDDFEISLVLRPAEFTVNDDETFTLASRGVLLASNKTENKITF